MSEEPATGTQAPQYDEAQIQYAHDQLRNEQNLPMGAIAGVFAALIGAGIWAAVTYFTSFQIGWMAVGVGFLVGYAIRQFGKGVDQVFGIVGAVLALVGCLLGNLLAVVAIVASAEQVAFLDVMAGLDLKFATDLMVATFSPIDLLFYGIAVWEGYKLSFREVTEADVTARISGSPQS